MNIKEMPRSVLQLLTARNGTAAKIRGRVTNVTPTKAGTDDMTVTNSGINAKGPWRYIDFRIDDGTAEIPVQWWEPTGTLGDLTAENVEVELGGTGFNGAKLTHRIYNGEKKIYVAVRNGNCKILQNAAVEQGDDNDVASDPAPDDTVDMAEEMRRAEESAKRAPAPAPKRQEKAEPKRVPYPTGEEPELVPHRDTVTVSSAAGSGGKATIELATPKIEPDTRGRIPLKVWCEVIDYVARQCHESYAAKGIVVDSASVSSTVNTVLIALGNGKVA